MFFQGGLATAHPAHHGRAPASGAHTESGLLADRLTTTLHRAAAAQATRVIERRHAVARRRHLAALAAARRARARAAAAARKAAARHPAPSPSPTASTPPPSSGGGDAANSPLGVCIRNSEEGGSYAWGPGNGGGAYQFELGTWEHYGGAADQYGVAGKVYQDQIFDNAIAAGGASNWTAYDGC